eukprot:CAMPEP_0179266778 /NCGR_PEP_ID=MMETSP0797-20121207/29590_1 /TAXON_ID=47934 /ORGANISM="Dinophysis acuminata, Strain DAEP01" /LENGTH=143 /DNA_ID=CAMNT_0020975019 /DNA_START=58 /DNA_END=489 /DNA_ORIENTATION=-
MHVPAIVRLAVAALSVAPSALAGPAAAPVEFLRRLASSSGATVAMESTLATKPTRTAGLWMEADKGKLWSEVQKKDSLANSCKTLASVSAPCTREGCDFTCRNGMKFKVLPQSGSNTFSVAVEYSFDTTLPDTTLDTSGSINR